MVSLNIIELSLHTYFSKDNLANVTFVIPFSSVKRSEAFTHHGCLYIAPNSITETDATA